MADRDDEFTAFVERVEPRLRQALVALCGPERGRDAVADGFAYAWEHWDRVRAMDNPAGYVYRVGRSRTRPRRTRAVFPDVTDGVPHVEPVVASDVIDSFATTERPRRRLLRVAVAAFVAIVVAVCGAIVLVGDDDSGRSAHVPSVAAPPTSEWSAVTDDAHGLSISYPPSWQPAPSTLTPALFDPVVPIALGTYPLEPERSDECDIVPQRALEAMGPTDAFIALYVYSGFASWGATTERPERFGADLPWHFTPDGKIQCTENVRGSVGHVSFEDHGRRLLVMIAIGPEASAERRAELYRILDTLTVTP